MKLGRVMSFPYQLVRGPLGVVDEHAVGRLSPDNPLRHAYRGALGVADTAFALLLDEPALVTGSDVLKRDLETTAPGRNPAGDELPDEEDRAVQSAPSPSDEQRRRDFASKEHQATRGNHTPAAMGRDLAQMQAVVEAREHMRDE
jgi:hypothetical protein